MDHGTPDLNLSRLTERIDPSAAKIAIRAAIFMPVCFLLASLLLGAQARPFAAFGAFILLAMVTFAGRPLPRALAWAGLVVVGCAFIVLGTWLSQFTVLAALAAGLLSFLVFFSGVIGPYCAAARNGAVLLIALPLMIEAPSSAIDDRLLGWLLACVVCIPATYLLWRLPWYGELRRQIATTARALAALVRQPASEELKEDASKQVWKLRKAFLSTPNRPTGVSGVSAAIATLVDEESWTYGLIANPGASIDVDREYARKLRESTAGLLEASAAMLENHEEELPLGKTEEALERLIDQNAADLKEQSARPGDEEAEEMIRHLDHEFRLRKLAFSVIDIARTTLIACEKDGAPGDRRDFRIWLRAIRNRAVGSRRVLARHSGLDSSWLRNSIRGALGIGLAVLVADLVAVQNAFWVVLGTLSILRSNALGTRGSVVQALAGTLVGILIGAGVIWLVGHEIHVLWIALPLAVLFAAYAQRAISFAAGQAGFALLVVVLYNLIEPVGWEVGLIRIQDVAIGCAVSLVVGFLIWPRGAAEMIRPTIRDALVTGAELVRDRARGVLEGRAGNRTDSYWRDSATASELLDAALRRYLDETTGDQIDRESLMALSAAGVRLRRTAFGIGRIPEQPWFERAGLEDNPRMLEAIDQACDPYVELGLAIAAGGPIPEAAPLDDAGWLLETMSGTDPEFGAGLGRIWLYENLQYLVELHHRYESRARMLFDFSSENPPPVGDAPQPRAHTAGHPIAAGVRPSGPTAQSG